MITVTVEKKGAEYIRFTCKGHAGYARAGRDIVCAAVSALVTNTVNSLEQLTGDSFETRTEDGFVCLDFPDSLSDRGLLLMDSLLLGLTETAHSVGNRYLQVRVREV
jgi:hypothetical protein